MPGGVKPLKVFEMMPYEEPTPSVPFVSVLWRGAQNLYLSARQRNLWLVGQSRNEEILRTYLAKYGVHTELATELVGFEQKEDSITVHMTRSNGDEKINESVTADWLIGAEGARSK